MASLVQPTHVLVAGAQTGVLPLQLAFVRHPTHVADVTSQRGFAPVQADEFVAEHCPHAPLDRQAGVAPPHCESLVQPVQALFVQIGVAPLQFAFVKQPTQVAVAVSQTGVAPVHLVPFVPEQRPHAPEDRHAGNDAGQFVSDVHGPQVLVVVLQTGVLVEHWVLFRHCTQTFGDTVVSQTGLAVGHCAFVVH